MNIFPAILLAFAPQIHGRIAVCADGNYHDRDDIGATAMTLALVWQANAQWSLVHYQHSTHLGANDSSQHAEMILSATGYLDGYAINPRQVFDAQVDSIDTASHLAREIMRASAMDRLTILQAGPWETMAMAFDIAPAQKHQYIRIISHSTWNDDHKHLPSHRNRADFFAQYGSGGPFSGHQAPSYIKIADQNAYAFRSTGVTDWEWMRSKKPTEFVLLRTKASTWAYGDMSDAGMMFFFLTGIEKPTMQNIRTFFGI